MNGGIVLTAEQWDVWADPGPMLDDCKDERKLRLFGCQCARRVWRRMPGKLFRDAVELAERLAEVGVSEKQRKALKNKCEAANPQATRNAAAAAATYCLSSSDPSSAAGQAAWAEAGTPEGPKYVAVRAKQADLLREIFGNPLRPVRVDPAWLEWNNRTVPRITERIYQKRRFADMPVLADALEDAGCTDAAILSHCREPREHVRGCWVLDLLRAEPT
jgi:hypothetical protein